jgi:hypothetical protein
VLQILINYWVDRIAISNVNPGKNNWVVHFWPFFLHILTKRLFALEARCSLFTKSQNHTFKLVALLPCLFRFSRCRTTEEINCRKKILMQQSVTSSSGRVDGVWGAPSKLWEPHAAPTHTHASLFNSAVNAPAWDCKRGANCGIIAQLINKRERERRRTTKKRVIRCESYQKLKKKEESDSQK